LYQELASPGLASMGSAARLVHAFSPRYPKAIQDTLVQNVFLTGGNVMYPGMKARVEKELLEMRPFQSSFQVQTALPTHCL
jgi:actin-related protein 5